MCVQASFPFLIDTNGPQISTHAMNSLFALFEIFIPRTERPPWIHLPFLILFLVMYLALAYTTYATQGFYTYGFLDPKNGTGFLIGYIFGIFAGICVVFVFIWMLVWFREWFSTSVLRLEGKLAKTHGGYEAGDQQSVKNEHTYMV